MAILLWVGGIIGFVAQLPQLGIVTWTVNIVDGTFSFRQKYKGAGKVLVVVHASQAADLAAIPGRGG